MKTFDEAMKLVVRVAPLVDVDGEVEKATAFHEKYKSLAVEVMDNPGYATLREFLYDAVSRGEMSPRSALLSAFMAGLQSGIEMEKADLVEVAS